MRELAETKSVNAQLNEQLGKANETILSLQASLKIPRREPSDVTSEEFIEQLGPSSTRRQETTEGETSREMTRFMSSVNQISVSSINVPECKPKGDGEEIGRHDFEAWKDLLCDSLKLAGVVDETTQFIIFKVKAGQALLDVFRNTKSSDEAPDEDSFPFSNAMHRLKAYYSSGSDVMLQRRKLALTIQKPEESDLSFLMRVGATARLCEFGEKEFEEIVSTVAEHAKNREVRTTALKLLSRKGTFSELVDKVREIEAIRLNEEFFRMKHGEVEQATVARVAVRNSTGGSNVRQWQGGRPAYRGRYSSQQTRWGGENLDRRPRDSAWRGTPEEIPAVSDVIACSTSRTSAVR